MTEARPLPARWIVLLHPFTAGVLILLAGGLWIAQAMMVQDPVRTEQIGEGYILFEGDELVLVDSWDLPMDAPRALRFRLWRVWGVDGTWSPQHRRLVAFSFREWLDWDGSMLPDGFEDRVRQAIERRLDTELDVLSADAKGTGIVDVGGTRLEFAAAGDGVLSLTHLFARIAGQLAWLVFALGLVVLPCSFWSAVRQRQAGLLESEGRCVDCGYPRLAGRPCPECGTEASVGTAIAERDAAARATRTIETKEPARAPSSHA